jgi:hypothetical protein
MENYVQQSQGTSLIKRGSLNRLGVLTLIIYLQVLFIYKISSLKLLLELFASIGHKLSYLAAVKIGKYP